MAKIIKYETGDYRQSLTSCPFGEQTQSDRQTVKVGSYWCIHACKYHGEKYSSYEVECNHP